MNQFIGILIRILSIAVILVNFLYIQHYGGHPSLNSYMAFAMPYIKWIMGAVVIGSIILMLSSRTTAISKVGLVIIILLALFPFYHGYLRSFFLFL